MKKRNIILLGFICLFGINIVLAENVGLLAFAVDSSNAGVNFIGNKSLDGDYGTRWVPASGQVIGSWFKVNLNQSYLVDVITLEWDEPSSSYTVPENVQFRFSDGSEVNLTINSTGGHSIFFSPQKNISWVNMTIISRKVVKNYVGLQEFEIYVLNLFNTSVYSTAYPCGNWGCMSSGDVYFNTSYYRGHTDSFGIPLFYAPDNISLFGNESFRFFLRDELGVINQSSMILQNLSFSQINTNAIFIANLTFSLGYTFFDCGDNNNVELWLEQKTSYDALNPTKNITHVKEGIYSMELSWNTSQAPGKIAYWKYATNVGNLSDYQNGFIKFWVYVINISDFGAASGAFMLFSIGSSYNDEKYIIIDVSDVDNGWNEIILDFETCSESGVINWSDIDTMEILMYENTTNPTNTSVIIDDLRIFNDNNSISLSWQIGNESEYIEMDYYIKYAINHNVSEEGLSFDFPVFTENYSFMKREDFTQSNYYRPYYFSAYTPHRIQIDNPNSKSNIIFYGDDTFEVFKVDNNLKWYSYNEILRNGSFFENNQIIAPPAIERKKGEKVTDSLRFKIIPDANLSFIIKSRWKNGRDAAITFGAHIDPGSAIWLTAYKRLYALWFGHSNISDLSYGTKGFVGHNLKYTQTIWAVNSSGDNQDVYFSLDYIPYKTVIDLGYDKGIDIGLHLVEGSGNGTNITISEIIRGLNAVDNYNSSVWIDHGPDNCSNDPGDYGMSGCGRKLNNALYLLEHLENHSFKYVWASGQDVAPDGNSWYKHLNMFYLTDSYNFLPKYIPPILYYNRLLDCETINQTIYLFGASMKAGKPQIWSVVLTKPKIREFCNQKGYHNAHTYLTINTSTYYPTWYMDMGGNYIINSSFDMVLQNLEDFQNSGELWVDSIPVIGDWLLSYQNIRTIKLNDSYIQVKNDNNYPISGVSYLLLKQNISSVKINNLYHIYVRDEYVILPKFNAGEMKNIYIFKDNLYNVSIPQLSHISNSNVDIIYASYNPINNKIYINVSCNDCIYNITIKNNKYGLGHFRVLRDGVTFNNWTLSGTTLTINGYSSSENQYIIEGYSESKFTYEAIETQSNFIKDIISLMQTIITFIIAMAMLAIVGYIVIFINGFINK